LKEYNAFMDLHGINKPMYIKPPENAIKQKREAEQVFKAMKR